MESCWVLVPRAARFLPFPSVLLDPDQVLFSGEELRVQELFPMLWGAEAALGKVMWPPGLCWGQPVTAFGEL